MRGVTHWERFRGKVAREYSEWAGYFREDERLYLEIPSVHPTIRDPLTVEISDREPGGHIDVYWGSGRYFYFEHVGQFKGRTDLGKMRRDHERWIAEVCTARGEAVKASCENFEAWYLEIERLMAIPPEAWPEEQMDRALRMAWEWVNEDKVFCRWFDVESGRRTGWGRLAFPFTESVLERVASRGERVEYWSWRGDWDGELG